MHRLTSAQLVLARKAIYDKQGGICPLCGGAFPFSSTCLDHDHVTGRVRGVLCRNCNGMEGRIKNLVNMARRGEPPEQYLGRVIQYWIKHSVDQWGLLHPLHKSDDEKRVRRNKLARKRRAVKKSTA